MNCKIGEDTLRGGDITLNEAFELYDRYKICTLIKILNEESEVSFYEEDDEEGTTNTKERDSKIFV